MTVKIGKYRYFHVILTFQYTFFLWVHVYVLLLRGKWTVNIKVNRNSGWEGVRPDNNYSRWSWQILSKISHQFLLLVLFYIFLPNNTGYNSLNHLLIGDTKGWGNLIFIIQLKQGIAVNNVRRQILRTFCYINIFRTTAN